MLFGCLQLPWRREARLLRQEPLRLLHVRAKSRQPFEESLTTVACVYTAPIVRIILLRDLCFFIGGANCRLCIMLAHAVVSLSIITMVAGVQWAAGGRREGRTAVTLYFDLRYNTRNKSAKAYSQSKAPFFHSYTNPMVRINKNTIIDQNPNKPILFKETAQGNKKVTSKYRVNISQNAKCSLSTLNTRHVLCYRGPLRTVQDSYLSHGSPNQALSLYIILL